jgi:hypothetical protein
LRLAIFKKENLNQEMKSIYRQERKLTQCSCFEFLLNNSGFNFSDVTNIFSQFLATAAMQLLVENMKLCSGNYL